MSLEVAIDHALPSLAIEAQFASAGQLTSLFGPSGCGKTTVINIIAGLIRPKHARIVCDGEVLADTAQRLWLPPHERRIGYVFQDARLLPHLSVQQNLRFGQWFTPQQRRYARENDIVEMLALSPLLQRRPVTLSGGERQRVALGRALLQSPRLLLMDEPLAALDETRKQEILPYIERLRDHAKVPIIYVSHDVNELVRLASDVALMVNGRVVEFGAIEQVLPHLASLGDDRTRDAGTVIAGTVASHDADNEISQISTTLGMMSVAGRAGPTGTSLRLHIRATDVTLSKDKPPHLSALNVFEGVVQQVSDDGGASVTVTVRCGNGTIYARITRYSARTMYLLAGQRVYSIIKAVAVRSPQSH